MVMVYLFKGVRPNLAKAKLDVDTIYNDRIILTNGQVIDGLNLGDYLFGDWLLGMYDVDLQRIEPLIIPQRRASPEHDPTVANFLSSASGAIDCEISDMEESLEKIREFHKADNYKQAIMYLKENGEDWAKQKISAILGIKVFHARVSNRSVYAHYKTFSLVYNGKHFSISAFIDTGSQATIISEVLARKMGIPLDKCDPIMVTGFGGGKIGRSLEIDIIYQNIPLTDEIIVCPGLREQTGKHMLVGQGVFNKLNDEFGVNLTLKK